MEEKNIEKERNILSKINGNNRRKKKKIEIQ